MFSQFFWKVKKFFRKLFRREWKHSQQELTVSFLETSLKLAMKGKAEVQHASFPILGELLKDNENYVYLLVFKTRRFKKPTKLSSRGWFEQYTFDEGER